MFTSKSTSKWLVIWSNIIKVCIDLKIIQRLGDIPGDMLSKLKSPHRMSKVTMSPWPLVIARNSFVQSCTSSNCFWMIGFHLEEKVLNFSHRLVVYYEINKCAIHSYLGMPVGVYWRYNLLWYLYLFFQAIPSNKSQSSIWSSTNKFHLSLN